MQPPAEQQSKPSVCRRLFADDPEPSDPDHDGVRDNMLNQISEEINRDLDDACKKYNFDFRNEVPLEGNWEWTPVNTPQRPGVQDISPPPEDKGQEDPDQDLDQGA